MYTDAVMTLISYNQVLGSGPLPAGRALLSRALPGPASRALCTSHQPHLPGAGPIQAKPFLKKSIFVYSCLFYVYSCLFFARFRSILASLITFLSTLGRRSL